MRELVQRWRDGRTSYRPAAECIRTGDFEVAPIADDTTARAFIAAHHYTGTYPAARFRFGLYRGAELAGVAVFSHPCSNAVLTNVFPGDARASVELGRFVLLDDVAGNGETWFLARCFEHLRAAGLHGVVSFSDPVARTCADGELVFPGHIGTIYQAHNARYVGRGARCTLRLLPDATVLAQRAVSKLRNGERGWEAAARRLEAFGASPAPRELDARRAWLDQVLGELTRPLRHPGNHKYAWALDRRVRKHMPAGLAYPKLAMAA